MAAAGSASKSASAEIENETQFQDFTWKAVGKYFDFNGGKQLVKHQLDSYNDFVLRKIEQIIRGFNTIEINHTYLPAHDAFKYVLRIDVSNPTLGKPTISERDGSTKPMTPADARQRNFTYSAMLTVDLRIEASTLQDLEERPTYTTESKHLTGVSLGKLPIMVGSRYCVLLNTRQLAHNECRHDAGGYFVVNGNEKILISQDRIAENHVYCFSSNKQASHRAREGPPRGAEGVPCLMLSLSLPADPLLARRGDPLGAGQRVRRAQGDHAEAVQPREPVRQVHPRQPAPHQERRPSVRAVPRARRRVRHGHLPARGV